MRVLIGLLPAMFLIACASDPSPSDIAENQRLFSGWMKCMVERAPTYDDGRSDAGTIATAVEWACPAERRALESYANKSLSISQQIQMAQDAAPIMHAHAVAAVLRSRKIRSVR